MALAWCSPVRPIKHWLFEPRAPFCPPIVHELGNTRYNSRPHLHSYISDGGSQVSSRLGIPPGFDRLPPKGGRFRARLKVANRAACERQFVHSYDRGPSYAHVLADSKNPYESDQLKADRLKAGGIKPGTWALKPQSLRMKQAFG